MSALQLTKRREGFTLVELIIVITIILLITALGAAFLPRFLDNQNQTRAIDQISQWLLTAKMRAKRDGLPTGLRILFDQNTNLATQLEYVQQPDPYTAGTCQDVQSNSSTLRADFTATGVDFLGAATSGTEVNQAYGELSLIVPGDFLELNGGGNIYNIFEVNASNVLTLANTNLTLKVPTSNYRIIRQPRRLLGEDVLTLPQDIVIHAGLSIGVPIRTVLSGGTMSVYEILFTPSGNVIGKGTQSGKIILWVCNATDPNGPVLNPNGPPAGGYNAATSSLITIQVRTGFIAAHPISLGANAYVFTEDGKSSGL